MSNARTPKRPNQPQRSNRPGQGSHNPDTRSAAFPRRDRDARPARPDSRPTRSDARSARPDSRPIRSDARPARRPNSPEFSRSKPQLHSKNPDQKQELYVWGRHVVESFLAKLAQQENTDVSKYMLHIIVDKNGKAPAQLKTAVDQAKFLGIKIIAHKSAEEEWPLVSHQDLNHQRICLTVPEYPTKHLHEVLPAIKQSCESKENGCVAMVLDQIQDPRNFGAILRSAAYFGVKHVIFGTDRQAAISPLVLKASAGGAFAIDLVPVTNINRALEQLKSSGCWIAGTSLEEGKTTSLDQLPHDRTWVAVMGNEEKGIRNEVAKNCDYLVKIPGHPQGVDSLNVSVATGVFLYQLTSTS